MIHVLRPAAPLALMFAIAACSLIPNPFPKHDRTPIPAETVPEDAPIEVAAPPPGAVTAETLDTASAEEVSAATDVSAPTTGFLGDTVAALGDPTKPGFWLMTPLVTSEQQGRIEREGGAVAQVTLIPLDGDAGAGSQLSLSAMRALNFSLTDLAPLKVYAN